MVASVACAIHLMMRPIDNLGWLPMALLWWALTFIAWHVCYVMALSLRRANRLEAETLRHFQALVRMDTTSPPGNEKPAADYVAQVLASEGIPVQVFALEAHRPSFVDAAAPADGDDEGRAGQGVIAEHVADPLTREG